eukprot:gene8117-8986_t
MSSLSRIRLVFKNFQVDLGKSCWFSIDKSECSNIDELHQLIKKRLGPSCPRFFRCYLKDTLLPGNERIELIRDEDEIVIESISEEGIFSAEQFIEENKLERTMDFSKTKETKKAKKKRKEDIKDEKAKTKKLKRKRKALSDDESDVEAKKVKTMCEVFVEEDANEGTSAKKKKKKSKKSKWDVKGIKKFLRGEKSSKKHAVVENEENLKEKSLSKKTLKESDTVLKASGGDIVGVNSSTEVKSSKKSKNVGKERKEEIKVVKFDNSVPITEVPKLALPRTPHISLKRKRAALIRNSKNEFSNVENTTSQNSFHVMSKQITNIKPAVIAKSKSDKKHIYFGSDEEKGEDQNIGGQNKPLEECQVNPSNALKIAAANDKQINVSNVYYANDFIKSNCKESLNRRTEAQSTTHCPSATVENNYSLSLVPPANETLDKSGNANVKKEYSKCLPLYGTPMPGDKIAYKILELSFDYTPVVSNYKEAEVLSFDDKKSIAKLCLSEESLPKQHEDASLRKFELPLDEDEDGSNEEDAKLVEVDWKVVIDPVLL